MYSCSTYGDIMIMRIGQSHTESIALSDLQSLGTASNQYKEVVIRQIISKLLDTRVAYKITNNIPNSPYRL